MIRRAIEYIHSTESKPMGKTLSGKKVERPKGEIIYDEFRDTVTNEVHSIPEYVSTPMGVKPIPIPAEHDLLLNYLRFIEELPRSNEYEEIKEDLRVWFNHYRGSILRYNEQKSIEIEDIRYFKRSRKDCLSALKQEGSITLKFKAGKIDEIAIRRLKGKKSYPIHSAITADFQRQIHPDAWSMFERGMESEKKGETDGQVRKKSNIFNFLLGDDADLILYNGGPLYTIIKQELQETLGNWAGYEKLHIWEKRNSINHRMILSLNIMWQWFRENKIDVILNDNKPPINSQKICFKDFLFNFLGLKFDDKTFWCYLGRSTNK